MMSEKQTYVKWLKEGFGNLRMTLKDPSTRQLLRAFSELILACFLGGGTIGLGVQIHWIFVILGIGIIALLVSHGFYLFEHLSDC